MGARVRGEAAVVVADEWSTPPLGDMPVAEFRAHAHTLADWAAGYFDQIETHAVLSKVTPGDIRAALPSQAPELPEPFANLLADLDRLVVPGATHWNHPGFFAYFAITGSAPAVLMDLVSSTLNQQAMLWRTSPVATELEEVTLRWLAQLMHLPTNVEGVIYDTASISTLHALAAAREIAIPDVRTLGLAGRDLPPLRLYCSEHAHSSVDKAVIALGMGHHSLRRIPADSNFSMRTDLLATAVAEDRAAGRLPVAVVASVGTTSSTSVDDVAGVADICERERMWLHVDAAYAGVMAMVPEFAWMRAGFDRADSLVVNPHKWLFTPFDLSVLFTRRMDVIRQAFSLTPEYLKTSEAGTVKNLMDTGIQLGRRFRSLKLWAVLRYFGAEGIRDRLREHVRLAQLFASWVDADPDWERVAPVPFSVVCFRVHPRDFKGSAAELDALNQRVLEAVNKSGDVFISHTALDGHIVLRLAVGNIRTEERHLRRAWELLVKSAQTHM
jgi:aromatic-L-amino-acid decarboxylase